MSLPLRGIRVLEMEGLAPTVLAGQMLSDLGAEVIIVSRPEQLPMSVGMEINVLNRGKKSVIVDIRNKSDI